MVIEVKFDTTDVYISTTVSPVYVNVSFEAPSGGGGAEWGDITGTLSDQTDLQTALDGKFDDPTGTTSQYLRGDGSLATFPAIPSGTVTSVGLTMPTAFTVANSPVTSSGTLAVTGAGTTAQYIRGDGSLDTFPSLTGFVPYTGATANVDLGTHRILAQNATISSSGSGDTVTLTHTSGSGNGLTITKGGNGEGLYINKTSGSGNAATIIGTLNATTLVKSGGTSSQFLKADGTVDSSVYVPTSTTLTINGVSYDLSANRSWTVAGGISGSGASGQVAYWTGTSAQSGSNNLFWDNSNGRLGIGTNTPTAKFQVNSSTVGDIISLSESTSNTSFKVYSQSSPAGSIVFELKANNTTTGACYTLFDGYLETWTNLVARSATSGNRWWRFGLAGATNYFAIQKLNDAATLVSGSPLTIFGTGNVLLQGNGTSTTDGGQRLQVQGTTLLNGNVTFSSATGMTWDATNSRLGIGTNAPTSTLNVIGASIFNGSMLVSVNQNASTLLTVSNATSGTSSEAAYLFTSSNGSGSIGKASASKTAYKTYLANDTLIYNSASGDISVLNDFATGNIKFAAGGSSTAHMTLHNTGNLLLGSTTNSGERLQVTGNVKVTGNVNIGNGTDSLILANSSTVASTNTLLIKSSASNTNTMLEIRPTGTANTLSAIYLRDSETAATSSNLMLFGRGNATLPEAGVSYIGNIVAGVTNANSFHLGFLVSSVALGRFEAMRMFNSGNAIFQSGGTYTDIASALVQMTSTTKGFLPPRMTTTQKNAISSPAAGLVVYDTTLGKLCVYTTAWETITSI